MKTSVAPDDAASATLLLLTNHAEIGSWFGRAQPGAVVALTQVVHGEPMMTAYDAAPDYADLAGRFAGDLAIRGIIAWIPLDERAERPVRALLLIAAHDGVLLLVVDRDLQLIASYDHLELRALADAAPESHAAYLTLCRAELVAPQLLLPAQPGA
jgi:hypothetical protein